MTSTKMKKKRSKNLPYLVVERWKKMAERGSDRYSYAPTATAASLLLLPSPVKMAR